MTDWLDTGSSRDRRKHRSCPGFYLVSCGHGGTINQEKNLRDRLGLGDKIPFQPVSFQYQDTSLQTKNQPIWFWVTTRRQIPIWLQNLHFGLFWFGVSFSVCLARNHMVYLMVYYNSSINESRWFMQRICKISSIYMYMYMYALLTSKA